VKEILSLVLTGNSLFSKTKHRRPGGEGEQSHDQVAISTIRPASDVIHVFSHIRKTYKPQWVVIEGTGYPPSLSTSPANVTPARKGRKSVAPKETSVQLQQGTDLVDDTNRTDDAIWVPLHQVMQTKYVPLFSWSNGTLIRCFSFIKRSMGTGVAKVWNMTMKLWEASVDNDR
jgi:A/G-specific adenine glycosylase